MLRKRYDSEQIVIRLCETAVELDDGEGKPGFPAWTSPPPVSESD